MKKGRFSYESTFGPRGSADESSLEKESSALGGPTIYLLGKKATFLPNTFFWWGRNAVYFGYFVSYPTFSVWIPLLPMSWEGDQLLFNLQERYPTP